ncbi:MAG: helix-turn-helix transcriptional regulator [Clostridiales bacterium]|nr:helix-turn-helix transcriptional regulator [Clostridiales bacterium]
MKDCRFTQTAFGTVVHDSSGAKTGISVSTLGQVEQGGRNLSMKNLYMLMEVYETDANSLLAIDCTPDSLDSRLKRLPADKQDYLKKTFDFMIEQALKSA